MKLLNVFVVLVLGVISFNSSAAIKAFYRCEQQATNKAIDAKQNKYEDAKYEPNENYIVVADEGYSVQEGGVFDKTIVFHKIRGIDNNGRPMMGEAPKMEMIIDETDPKNTKFAIFKFTTDVKGKDGKFHSEHIESIISLADCLPSE